MMCQQCEAAPCETVCPVGATNHTADGLNSQAYNRCVGSRYCSANCPFKVRYFNWYDYPTTENVWPAEMTQQLNPDITLRSKGVMEKCTFCVQRIRAGERAVKNEGRILHDGEVQTACQQVCPSGAITFGNLIDPESKVHQKWKAQRVELTADEQEKDKEEGGTDLRGYRILEELRPYPSVMYMERVRESAI
jgi:molybdopterin-containing oxidoreductase family iron-sulfur binding subunit